MTATTKKYKVLKNIFSFLSFLATIAPILIYTIIGFVNGDIHTGKKVMLTFALVVSIILVILNVLFKYNLRSPIFIMIFGLYFALEKILPLLIIISIGVVLDEFILTPLAKSFKEKYVINKEIDKRG